MKNTQKQFDVFTNYTFSGKEWSAPMLKSAEMIKKELDKMQLVGKQIRRMKMIGLSYYLTRDWIEDVAYSRLSHLPKDERQYQSNYKNIPPDMEFLRYSDIDEPFLIEFEDGDVFEIDTPQDPYYRFSMNRIPWGIGSGANSPNVDANGLFSVCIGKRIKEVEVTTYKTDKDPMSGEPFDDKNTEYEFVSRIVLWLENDVGIRIHPVFDYCRISCIDKNNECISIYFKKLKETLFNYEDLHTDETLDFEGSRTLYFGKKGSEYADAPYMSFVPSGKETELHIPVDDFDLFAWSMSIVLKEQFDEYSDYSLSYDEWNNILNEAQKILDFKTFDDLFDYIVAQFENGLRHINIRGAAFWKNKDEYKTQFSDVSRWSKLVLSKGDTLNIYGF